MKKKAVIYIRVSSKEQAEQGYSPDAQKRLLWQFARSNGFDVVQEFEEAETAKDAGRKAFNAMLAFLRKEKAKYILVEKTDRLHRNFRDYATIEDVIEEHGITVHFVKEAVAIGTESKSSDKLMYGMRTLIAKNFIDNLREEVKKGQNEKLEHGEYPAKALLGYLNAEDPTTRRACIIVDEANKSLMQEMFRLYSTGSYSLKSLINELETKSLTNNLPVGRRLNKTSVAALLANPFYIGHFRWGGKVHKGKHEAIVAVELWQKVQDILAGKNINKTKKHNIIPFAYKGLLTCGECERTITAERKKGKYVYYRCTKYDRTCTQKPVKEEAITESVSNLLDTLDISENGMKYIVAGLKKSLHEKREWHDVIYNKLVKEHTTIKNRLDRMYEDRLDRKITDDYFEKMRNRSVARLDDLEVQIAKHNRADVSYYDFGVKILELAKNAKYLYKMATPEEKQELLRFLLSNSTLKDGKPEFVLKQPFSAIAKRSPLRERSTWGGQRESNPY